MSGLDSGWYAVSLYCLVSLVALTIGYLERGLPPSGIDVRWPTFWFGTAGLFAVMAIGRGTDSGGLLAELGRDQARAHDWYQTRRTAQTFLVGSIGAIWLAAVALAIWRVPARRRRYLPTSIAVVTLLSYTAVRLISLHQIDSLLYHRDVDGVTVNAIIELALLSIVIVAAAVRTPSARRRGIHHA